MCHAELEGGNAWAAAAEAERSVSWASATGEEQLDHLLRAEGDYETIVGSARSLHPCDAAVVDAASAGYKSVRSKLQHLNLSELRL